MAVFHVFAVAAVCYLREFAEVAFAGFFAAGFISAVVNKSVVARHLDGNVVAANALAVTCGFLTPLCCCSGIPTALALYDAGSRRGPACAFLIAVPWFNWYGVTALVVFLGWRAGLAVSMSAVAVGFLAGMFIDTVGSPSTSSKAQHTGYAHGCDRSCSPQPVAGRLLDLSHPWEKAKAGIRFALHLLRSLGPWMVAGILFGAAAQAFIPQGALAGYLIKTSIMSVLASAIVAGVWYTESVASLPLVRTLLDKGVGIGSGMVLLVAGVATNIATLGPVARVMGTRTAIVYASSVVLLTIVLGYWLNQLL